MMKKLFIYLIITFLIGCNNSTTPAKDNNVAVSLTIPQWLLQQDIELVVFDQTANNELTDQTMLFALEKETKLQLKTGSIYKFTINPSNNPIDVACPLFDGCITDDNKKVNFGQLLSTRLSFSAIKYISQEGHIELSMITDLAVKLLEGEYVEVITPSTIKQVNSVLANTLGVISYQAIDKTTANISNWNAWLKKAINIAILFEKTQIKYNATSHLKTINRRLLHTLISDDNRLDEFNQFIIPDTAQYLQQLALSDEIAEEYLDELAKLRAYVLSKAIYPNKGFLPSPYFSENNSEISKHFLDDYRSLLYTFADESNEYHQVNQTVTTGYELIDRATQTIFDNLFSLFSDVIKQVPVSSTSGVYQVDTLNVNYNKADSQWQIEGLYHNLNLNLTMTLEQFRINPIEGNLYEFTLSGQLATQEMTTVFETSKISLFYTPPENPFGGLADGTGYITLNSTLQIEDENASFNGDLTLQINTHKNINEEQTLIQHVEFAQVYGELEQAQDKSQLSLSLVHPNINNEVQANILPDNLITAVNYSGSVLGLGEPLLTMYLPYKSVQKGLDLNNLDIIAYFEGRLSQFQFNGTDRTFTYQGKNQDGVQWSLTYNKKEAEGQVTLQNEEQGTPRVLKDLAGIMFNDGNFISIF